MVHQTQRVSGKEPRFKRLLKTPPNDHIVLQGRNSGLCAPKSWMIQCLTWAEPFLTGLKAQSEKLKQTKIQISEKMQIMY